ncbi:MAG: hypothetical protein ACE148_04775 [Vicinamibacterales bacterium]
MQAKAGNLRDVPGTHHASSKVNRFANATAAGTAMAEERDQSIANPASRNEEKEEEGSSATVEEPPAHIDEGKGARDTMERGVGQKSQPEWPLATGSTEQAPGIANRPLPEEDERQARMPPRGESR